MPTRLARWDARVVRRALVNLLDNAIKYGGECSPVTVRVSEAGERVAIAVHNEGSTVSAEEMEHLFSAYQRARDGRRAAKKGWGLGLALVKGVADAHGGVVQVASSAEGGTTFTLSLPRDGNPVDPLRLR